MRKRLLVLIALLSGGTAHAQGQSDLNIKAEAAYKQVDGRVIVVYRQAQRAMKALDAQNTSRGGGFGSPQRY